MFNGCDPSLKQNLLFGDNINESINLILSDNLNKSQNNEINQPKVKSIDSAVISKKNIEEEKTSENVKSSIITQGNKDITNCDINYTVAEALNNKNDDEKFHAKKSVKKVENNADKEERNSSLPSQNISDCYKKREYNSEKPSEENIEEKQISENVESSIMNPEDKNRANRIINYSGAETIDNENSDKKVHSNLSVKKGENYADEKEGKECISCLSLIHI